MKIVGRRKFERISLVCTDRELQINGDKEHCKVFDFLMAKGYTPTDTKPLHQIAARAYGIRCANTDPLAFVPDYNVITAERPWRKK